MRVNVYAEELTGKISVISKEIEGMKFTGLMFWLKPSVTVGEKQLRQHPDDYMLSNDSTAITFWGKSDLRQLLRNALELLDGYYDAKPINLSINDKIELDERSGGACLE